MTLTVDFSDLHAAINKMNPEKTARFYYHSKVLQYDTLDIELAQGIDCDLNEVDFDTGLLSYKGRQVVLYIKDHGDNVLSAIEDPHSHGRKFHVADCPVLRGMRNNGADERYVVTNEISGDFLISGRHFSDGREMEEKAKLKVCKYCLSLLLYKGYIIDKSTDVTQIYNDFSLSLFFSTYYSFFSYPRKLKEQKRQEYTHDWRKIAARYKAKINYICEQCALNMRADKNHIYAHHINSDKSDNAEPNLIGLCVDCHRKLPENAHLHISHDLRQWLTRSRRKQGLLTLNMSWDETFECADPGLHGLLYHCKNIEIPVPEIGYIIKNEQKEVLAWVDLAWPQHKFAVAISKSKFEWAHAEGWEIISMSQFLNNPEKIMKCIS